MAKKSDICKKCGEEVKKGIRLCPNCGVLNPTLRVKDIFLITIILTILMWIGNFLYK